MASSRPSPEKAQPPQLGHESGELAARLV